jgi:hypothetical protein
MKLRPTLLSYQEYKQLSAKAFSDGFWRNDKRVFLPGMGWYADLYLEYHDAFLSVHYHRDWMGKRPPIELVCPNGFIWCVDRKSSNGDGWTVTGEWPNITCSPSIVAGDYHGFLQNGEFTADLDGKTFPVPNIGPDYGRKI